MFPLATFLFRMFYLKLREQWTINQGTTITDVRSTMGISQPQGYSGQDRLGSLDSHLASEQKYLIIRGRRQGAGGRREEKNLKIGLFNF